MCVCVCVCVCVCERVRVWVSDAAFLCADVESEGSDGEGGGIESLLSGQSLQQVSSNTINVWIPYPDMKSNSHTGLSNGGGVLDSRCSS